MLVKISDPQLQVAVELMLYVTFPPIKGNWKLAESLYHITAKHFLCFKLVPRVSCTALKMRKDVQNFHRVGRRMKIENSHIQSPRFKEQFGAPCVSHKICNSLD
jgi:hypothetical protein